MCSGNPRLSCCRSPDAGRERCAVSSRRNAESGLPDCLNEGGERKPMRVTLTAAGKRMGIYQFTTMVYVC